MHRISPRTTVLSGVTLGLIAGAAVYGAVSPSVLATSSTGFTTQQSPVAAAPVLVHPGRAADCDPGLKLENGVCIVRVVRTILVPATGNASAPAGTPAMSGTGPTPGNPPISSARPTSSNRPVSNGSPTSSNRPVSNGSQVSTRRSVPGNRPVFGKLPKSGTHPAEPTDDANRAAEQAAEQGRDAAEHAAEHARDAAEQAAEQAKNAAEQAAEQAKNADGQHD